MATVAHLFRAAKPRLPMVKIQEAEAIASFGLAGCAHGKKNGKRQVLLVDQETLDAMGLQPGIIRENVTTQGLNVNGLVIGEQLRIGEVLLQVVFTASGDVKVLRVVQGLGHGLDEAAQNAARQIRFKPAQQDGQPVDSTAIVHIVFNLAY